jgi:undecaprenyl diphosphate synthase
MAMLVRPPQHVVLDPARLPQHVAIVMDGNRRWARARRLPVVEGHRRGIVALREITRAASDWNIPMLTVYGFSTENWKRDANEVSLLLDLCVFFARSELAELRRNNVRVNVIGRYEELPTRSRDALTSLMQETRSCTGLRLNLAVNYSGRLELGDAMRAIAADVRDGRLAPDAIDEERVAAYLYTAGMPDPELVIRPGGEARLSNFLLYQAAASEFLMTETLWPDFDREAFALALAEFQRRQASAGA